MSFSYEPKLVLRGSFLPEYESTCNVIRNNLERLHINKFIIDKIRNYPISEILDEYRIAISILFFNSIEISLLICTKLLTDNKTDLITLHNFKKTILENILEEALRLEFQDSLGEIKMEGLDKIKKKLLKIRKSTLAHLKYDLISPNFRLDELVWHEFESIVAYMNHFAKVLTFHQSTIFLDTLDYHPETTVSSGSKNDFVRILEVMEDGSSLVKGIAEYELNREIASERMTSEEKTYINSILERNAVSAKI